ncbi:MAG: nucleoside triphosphate pyrophosphohydrolase, partial [Atribacterota bacterium]
MLLHIVFHAQMGEENGTFTLEDVLKQLIYKMKKRHPHVFGDTEVRNVDEVLLNWEKIKGKEKKRTHMLASIPASLPALLRAHAIQSRVARVGFDWKDATQVWDKVNEERDEFKSAWNSGDQKAMENEWGDLIFALVNCARHLGIQPEDALQKASGRFVERFAYVENEIKKEGKGFEQVSLEEMDEIWNRAKREIRSIPNNEK